MATPTDWAEHKDTLLWLAGGAVSGLLVLVGVLLRRLWCREVSGPNHAMAVSLAKSTSSMESELKEIRNLVAAGLSGLRKEFTDGLKEIFARQKAAEDGIASNREEIAELRGVCIGKGHWDGLERRKEPRRQ